MGRNVKRNQKFYMLIIHSILKLIHYDLDMISSATFDQSQHFLHIKIAWVS
jgi:hypothetical protein